MRNFQCNGGLEQHASDKPWENAQRSCKQEPKTWEKMAKLYTLQTKLLHPFYSFLVSSFCLPAISPIFHSKNDLHDTCDCSSLIAADFCLTGYSPVFVCITTLLYVVLLTLCSRFQTQHVCRVLHPMSGGEWDPGGWGPPGSPTCFFSLDFS